MFKMLREMILKTLRQLERLWPHEINLRYEVYGLISNENLMQAQAP